MSSSKHQNDTLPIMWLGSVFDEAIMASHIAISPAANRWQNGLVQALQRFGVSLSMLGHLPEPLWPKGPIRVSTKEGRLASGINGRLVNYWNVPWIRRKHLTFQYCRALRMFAQEKRLPQILISYNATPHNIEVGLWLQKEYGIPWICIIADLPEASELAAHDKSVEQAAGRVYLSWRSYDECNQTPKLHLDGGVERIRFDPNGVSEPISHDLPIILYTGTLSQWGGVNLLVKAFGFLKHPYAELWICGKGSNQTVIDAATDNPRIKFLGLVSETQLEKISRRATIFVNPRPSALSANHANFPSKVLEYLSYGKPVISTWTGGLAPEYRDVLTVLDEETETCLAQAIDDTLLWDQTRQRDLALGIKAFLENTRLWEVQVRRLLDWIDREISTK